MPPTAKKAAKPGKPGEAEKPAAEARVKPAPARKAEAGPEPAAVSAAVKLKALVDKVAATTGLKKPEAKAAVEATLATLAEALSANATLTVPPLGKLRVVKSVGGALTLKLRQHGAAKPGAKALADDPQDD
jgi:hypothetical protein